MKVDQANVNVLTGILAKEMQKYVKWEKFLKIFNTGLWR